MRAAERAAVKAAGLARYFTGTACPRGHLADRFVSNGSCITCTEESKKLRRAEYPELESLHAKARRLKDPEAARARDRADRIRNPEGTRERLRRWRVKNPDYEARRRQSNLQVFLAFQLRNRFKGALRCRAKAGSAVRDLGCTIPELIVWLERQFQPGMRWENYGDWHIDHRRPLASFDLADRAQVLVACHWTNLQPLWAVDNLRKGARHAA